MLGYCLNTNVFFNAVSLTHLIKIIHNIYREIEVRIETPLFFCQVIYWIEFTFFKVNK